MQVVENLVITTYSAEETVEFGAELAGRLKKGDNLLLSGELSAGKTTMLQGVGRFLGIEQNIISPTFQLIKKYNIKGGPEFTHVDLYRLNSIEEILRLGWWDIIESSQIVAVEWSEKAKEVWPSNAYIINMSVIRKGIRKIEITAPA